MNSQKPYKPVNSLIIPVNWQDLGKENQLTTTVNEPMS